MGLALCKVLKASCSNATEIRACLITYRASSIADQMVQRAGGHNCIACCVQSTSTWTPGVNQTNPCGCNRHASARRRESHEEDMIVTSWNRARPVLPCATIFGE